MGCLMHPILVIDLKVIALEITPSLLEITNTHTAVLLNQEKIIDRDTIVLTQTRVGYMIENINRY